LALWQAFHVGPSRHRQPLNVAVHGYRIAHAMHFVICP
jgi:hypothetical protein